MFKNICVSHAGLTDAELQFVKDNVPRCGGEVVSNISPKTTHLLIHARAGDAYKQVSAQRGDVEFVTVDWIRSSIGANRLLPSKGFLPPFGTDDGSADDFLKGLSFYIDDEIGDLAESVGDWQRGIEVFGGQWLPHFDAKKCTHVVMMYKSNKLFVDTIEKDKSSSLTLVSPQWLHHILTERHAVDPASSVLYQPVKSSKPIEGMEDALIAMTGYEGEDRKEVKDLITLCGAKYSGTLSPDNTHLVCLKPEGKKYEKALEWKCNVVVRKWLEDCLKSWTKLAEDKYEISKTVLVHDSDSEEPPGANNHKIVEKKAATDALNNNGSGDGDEEGEGEDREGRKRKERVTATASAAAAKRKKKKTKENDEDEDILPQQAAEEAEAGKKEKEKKGASTAATKVDKENSHNGGSSKIVVTTGNGDGKKTKESSHSPRFCFSLSGDEDQRREWTRIITKLGGQVSPPGFRHSYDPQATHFILDSLRRTEKYLCGTSAGKWLLQPSYLQACDKAGKFVEETSFEYFGTKTTKKIWMGAARHWRLHIKSNNSGGIFANERVAFVGDLDPSASALASIVVAGAGQHIIIDVDGKNNNSNSKTTPMPTMIIAAKKSNVPSRFVDANTPVFTAEYILDFVSLGPTMVDKSKYAVA